MEGTEAVATDSGLDPIAGGAAEMDFSDVAGDEGGEEVVESYQEWLAKDQANGRSKKEAKPEEKKSEAKSDQAEEETDGEGGTAKEAKDNAGNDDDGVPGEGDNKAESEPRTYTYKVDGEERTATVLDKDIPQLLSKAEGADKVFNEAANIRKQAGELVNFMKDNPIAALEKIGVDFSKLAEDHVYEKIQYESMDENQRQTHDRLKKADADAAKLKQYEEEKEAARKAEEERVTEERKQQEIAHQQKILETQIMQAIDTTGLPRNKFTVTRMAMYMRQGLKQGVTAMDVAAQVKADYDEALEQARQSRVAEHHSNPKPSEPKVTKHKPRGGRRKRVTSIYDLLE